eukprot:4637907-Ditylum_brightwellii.AAC.1
MEMTGDTFDPLEEAIHKRLLSALFKAPKRSQSDTEDWGTEPNKGGTQEQGNIRRVYSPLEGCNPGPLHLQIRCAHSVSGTREDCRQKEKGGGV